MDNVVAVRLRHLTLVAIRKGIAIALKEVKVVKKMIKHRNLNKTYITSNTYNSLYIF